MGGVLHPVGPESALTYWIRRGLVLVALAAAVAVVTGAAVNLTQSANASGPVNQPSPAITTPTPTPAAASSLAVAPSVSAASSKSAVPSKPAAGASPRAAVCDPSRLRVTLTGRQRLRVEQQTTFEVSLINGGAQACRLVVDQDVFELRVTSGTDRMWSSRDCAKALTPRSATLEAEEALIWTMNWNGRRSGRDCRVRSEIPRAGTYVATARLRGAEPVRLRLQVAG